MIFTLDISSPDGMTMTGNLSDEIMKILASLQNSDKSSTENNQTLPS